MVSNAKPDFYELIASESKIEEIYSTPLKAIVAAIPYVGGSIDGIISSKETEYKDKRIKALFYMLKASLDKVEESKVDKDWIESEEFYDLLSAAIQSSIKSRSIDRIKMNAMILSNVLIVENSRDYRPEEYLAILSELTPLECKVLLVIYKKFQAVPMEDLTDVQHSEKVGWKEAIIEECGIEKDDLEFVMKRLERTGFVKEINGMIFDYNGGEYFMTKTCDKFMEYLKLNPIFKELVQ